MQNMLHLLALKSVKALGNPKDIHGYKVASKDPQFYTDIFEIFFSFFLRTMVIYNANW
jgi:hypothetical protein